MTKSLRYPALRVFPEYWPTLAGHVVRLFAWMVVCTAIEAVLWAAAAFAVMGRSGWAFAFHCDEPPLDIAFRASLLVKHIVLLRGSDPWLARSPLGRRLGWSGKGAHAACFRVWGTGALLALVGITLVTWALLRLPPANAPLKLNPALAPWLVLGRLIATTAALFLTFWLFRRPGWELLHFPASVPEHPEALFLRSHEWISSDAPATDSRIISEVFLVQVLLFCVTRSDSATGWLLFLPMWGLAALVLMVLMLPPPVLAAMLLGSAAIGPLLALLNPATLAEIKLMASPLIFMLIISMFCLGWYLQALWNGRTRAFARVSVRLLPFEPASSAD